jgi:predicted metal-dependent phosphoesterase TrpH
MSELGRADLHIHSLASDGVSSVSDILARAVATGLDVIAITDHERIDAAVAARAMAQSQGMPIEVIVGEEVSTRGVGATVRGKVLRDGTGRDLGYPGGRYRPPRLELDA